LKPSTPLWLDEESVKQRRKSEKELPEAADMGLGEIFLRFLGAFIFVTET
jgi:hypothetical protein